MAANLNRVFLIGNLTRDPEVRYVPSGTAVTSFTIAVNRVYQDKAGAKKEDVTFVRVVVWGRRAEVCGQYLSKGSPVFVEGRLRTRSWQAQDGQARSTTEVVANSVQFLRGAAGKAQTSEVPEINIQTEETDAVDLNGGHEKNAKGAIGQPADNSEEIPF